MKIVTINSATLQYFELLSSQLWLPTIEKTFAAPLILCLWGIDIYKMLWRVREQGDIQIHLLISSASLKCLHVKVPRFQKYLVLRGWLCHQHSITTSHNVSLSNVYKSDTYVLNSILVFFGQSGKNWFVTKHFLVFFYPKMNTNTYTFYWWHKRFVLDKKT